MDLRQLKLVLIVFGLLSPLLAAGQEALWSAAGGQSKWRIYYHALGNLGLTLEGKQVERRGSELQFRMSISGQTSLEFDGAQAKFQRLRGGAAILTDRLTLRTDTRRFELAAARLVPLDHGAEAALALVDAAGAQLFTLSYGHYDYQPSADRLDVWAMDVFLGPDLASALGLAPSAGVLLGQISLHLDVVAPPGFEHKGGSQPNVPDPNWPTEPGFEADLELQRIEIVSETATSRAGNRVAITPSAYFENIGSADLPWYAMFTRPPAGPAPDESLGEDKDCIDDGNGQCQPYGVDQGGLLAWQLYRLSDGRFEQLGRSGVKHAWNSINFCPEPGGRIVPPNCADRYGVGNNADQNVLGPRSEIEAAAVTWAKLGSIWDGNNDGDCDNLNPSGFPHDKAWCLSNPADEFTHRLAVNADQLQTPGARYFLEAWYLVRQDVNIFNSMGYQEITPTFTANGGAGVWTFPCTQGQCINTFVNGPALNAFVNDTAPAAGATSSEHNTAQGRVRLASTATALEPGRYRYDYALMNFDFDRRIDRVSIPLPPFARVQAVAVSDGDDDVLNDWSIFVQEEQLLINAPTSGELDWGSQLSIRFESALPPVAGAVEMGVAEPGLPALFLLDANRPLDDAIWVDSFETPP